MCWPHQIFYIFGKFHSKLTAYVEILINSIFSSSFNCFNNYKCLRLYIAQKITEKFKIYK
ncbi:hypothetical protein O3M35_004875 [Rhynocoris fuscipes]|uniref:Uncharacterized protein n=1 Tax=Rhynocoris fuscipes TaxID=488301 RepID=A0AAW1DH07_9HEMI